jgi:hypothetical protein
LLGSEAAEQLRLPNPICRPLRTSAPSAVKALAVPAFAKATAGKLGALGDLGGSMSLLLPLLLIQETLAVLETALAIRRKFRSLHAAPDG